MVPGKGDREPLAAADSCRHAADRPKPSTRGGRKTPILQAVNSVDGGGMALLDRVAGPTNSSASLQAAGGYRVLFVA